MFHLDSYLCPLCSASSASTSYGYLHLFVSSSMFISVSRRLSPCPSVSLRLSSSLVHAFYTLSKRHFCALFTQRFSPWPCITRTPLLSFQHSPFIPIPPWDSFLFPTSFVAPHFIPSPLTLHTPPPPPFLSCRKFCASGGCQAACGPAQGYSTSLDPKTFRWPDINYNDHTSSDWQLSHHLLRTGVLPLVFHLSGCSCSIDSPTGPTSIQWRCTGATSVNRAVARIKSRSGGVRPMVRWRRTSRSTLPRRRYTMS